MLQTPPYAGFFMKKIFWIASTYYAEGLPFSLVQQVSVQFFTAAGAGTPVIGLLSLLGLPWNLKFLWSPLIDLFGNKKKWIYLLELALALVAALLIWPAQEVNLGLAFKLFALMAILSATHDMAVDGFYIQTLPKMDQAAYSGLRVAAYRVAMLVGNSLLVIIAGWLSWILCFSLAAAMLIGLSIWHQKVLPRSLITREEGQRWQLVWRSVQSYLHQPHIGWALLFIVLFPAGDALMFAMVTPFLHSLGYGLVARGILTGAIGTITGIAGSILGGLFIARWGLQRTIFPLTLIQSFAILGYAWLAYSKPVLIAVVMVAAFEQFAAGLGTAVLMVFLMQRCQGGFEAMHFAIGSALMSVASTFLGSYSGFLVRDFGYASFFLLSFGVALPSLFLAFFMPSAVFLQDQVMSKSPLSTKP